MGKKDTEKKIPVIIKISAAVIGAAVGAALIFLAVCAFLPAAEFEINEDGNGSLVYSSDGELYAELRRYSRGDIGELSDAAERRFADGNIFSSPLSWISCFTGGSGKSISALAVLDIIPDDSGFSLIAHSRFLEQYFGSEEKLLRYYCSSADLGNGIYGLDRAARYYFCKTANTLTDDEMKALRAVAGSGELKARDFGAIASDTRFAGLSFRGGDSSIPEQNAYISRLCDAVTAELVKSGYTAREAAEMLWNGGLRIYSCLDTNVQAAVDESITSADNREFRIAMTVMDGYGAVCALTGGNDLVDRTVIPRPIGSAVKPLSVYAPAIESGLINYSSLVPDSPFDSLSGWPRNFDNSYDGEVTTAYAIRRSKNTSAVHLADRIGINVCAEWLDKLGISLPDSDITLNSLALGYFSSGMTPTEMCAAYQAFSNGGAYYEPYMFTEVRSESGEVIFSHDAQRNQVFSPQTAYIINRLLLSNVDMESGLGGAARIEGTEVYGKTGTVDNSSGVITDTTFAGAIPGYVGAVWVGLDNRDSTEKASYLPTGSGVWHSVFTRFAPPGSFEATEGTVKADFCTNSGLLAGDGCTSTETGYYRSDALPEKCNICY